MEARWFTREGSAYNGAVARDGNGRPAFSRLRRCGRCGGAGYWSGWPDGGRCYDCNGKGDLGYEAVRVYGAEELAKLNATRDKRRAKNDAKRAAKIAAAEAEAAAKLADFVAANAEVVAAARKYAEKSAFLADLVAKLEKFGSWSDKQIAAIAKTVGEIAEKEIKMAASGYVGAVGDRIEMKVTVERVASYERRSFGGYAETVWILTMRDEAGNAIVTKSPRFYGEKGESFVLRATVKEHSEYNTEKQTVVQRAAKIVGS
jgi:hypothetical protein